MKSRPTAFFWRKVRHETCRKASSAQNAAANAPLMPWMNRDFAFMSSMKFVPPSVRPP